MKNKIILFILILISFLSCKQETVKKDLTVSILPQKYFVERIVNDKFTVNVMVRPGFSPHNYEPLPEQMKDLTNSKLFFRIGVPFEKSWINKIQNINPEMKIIDTRNGIKLRKFKKHQELHDGEHDSHDHDEEHDSHHHDDANDPHIWLSPQLVKIQAENIYNAIIEIDPDNKKFYKNNLDLFLKDLDNLHNEISTAFEKIKNNKILVFHPAWGYFADEFGLIQIPIEVEGKEPGPAQLAKIIEFSKKENIKVIFVQEQFSKHSANAIAEEIGAAVISIDPLSDDYIDNIKKIADTIIKNLE